MVNIGGVSLDRCDMVSLAPGRFVQRVVSNQEMVTQHVLSLLKYMNVLRVKFGSIHFKHASLNKFSFVCMKAVGSMFELITACRCYDKQMCV